MYFIYKKVDSEQSLVSYYFLIYNDFSLHLTVNARFPIQLYIPKNATTIYIYTYINKKIYLKSIHTLRLRILLMKSKNYLFKLLTTVNLLLLYMQLFRIQSGAKELMILQ